MQKLATAMPRKESRQEHAGGFPMVDAYTCAMCDTPGKADYDKESFSFLSDCCGAEIYDADTGCILPQNELRAQAEWEKEGGLDEEGM
jgi:hypothetical protein